MLTATPASAGALIDTAAAPMQAASARGMNLRMR
jgi:hypothetical protein